jgi:hypothetical protein
MAQVLSPSASDVDVCMYMQVYNEMKVTVKDAVIALVSRYLNRFLCQFLCISSCSEGLC